MRTVAWLNKKYKTLHHATSEPFADEVRAELMPLCDQDAAEAAINSEALAGKYGHVLAPFVALMAAELHANARKGDRPGWLSMSREVALLEIYWHTSKLSAAVKNNEAAAICEHSADVANMAMMLLDVCGGLQAAACEWPTCECAMDLKRCKARA